MLTAQKKLVAVAKSVFILVFAEPYVVRFVKAEVNAAGGKAFFYGGENVFEKFVRSRLVGKQNIVYIENFVAVCAPALERAEVRKRLYKRHQLYAYAARVFVELAYFRGAVSAAFIAEIRLTLPPRSDLRNPGKISKLGGFRAPDGDSTRVRERERHGETSISRN